MPTWQRPNVLLVVLDSVRAANCSLYDADHDTTPFLSTYADRATVYDQARAPSNWTLPSHVSTFTGLDAQEHRVTVQDRLEPGHTVFERLADRHGYATGLFTENGFLAGHDVGLHRAFGTVETIPDRFDARYDTRDRSPGPDGFYYADRLLSWIDDRDGPWAACCNLMDAHRPYEPRPTYDRWSHAGDRETQDDLPIRWEWAFHGGERPMWHLHALESLYDGGIRQDDAVLRRLIAGLATRDCHDDTLVVVVGDHGEGFGEPGRLAQEPPAVAHLVPMHETLLHVPLVVSAPNQRSGHRVDAPASPRLFPEVVETHVGAGAEGPDLGGFVPDGPVRASKQPVTADLRERFADACEDVAPYVAPSHARYTPHPDREGAVRKCYHWGRDAAELRVDGPRTITTEDSIPVASVRSAFESPDSGPLTADHDAEPDAETRTQLAALGYY